MTTKKVIITGGAGFIGSRAAAFFALNGYHTIIVDNLSRLCSREYLKRISDLPRISFYEIDIRDKQRLHACLREHANSAGVIHLAAQVGVNASIADPVSDFAINAQGTLNLLEGLRLLGMDALLVFASTNKVYGQCHLSDLVDSKLRCDSKLAASGFGETQEFQLGSPYGCSKGVADIYVMEYHRTYNLRSVVLRQSCICGPGQISSEEQGWVAWMMIAHAIGKPIRIFGDGKQVRDILHVDDLIGLFECLLQNTSIASGKIYNVGGGTDNTLSLMELLEFLRRRSGREVEYCFGEARPLDQRYFVSNTRLVQRELQWRPRITRNAILDEMWNWVSTHNDVLAQLYR